MTYRKAKQDSVRSPSYIFDWVRSTFGKFYDPVPYRPKFDLKKHKDALTTEWKQVNYANIPFSEAKKFILKGYEQYKKGRTVIMLVKTDVLSTSYFSKCPGAEIKFFMKPVIFPPHQQAPRFNVCLLIWRAGKRSKSYSFFNNTKNT